MSEIKNISKPISNELRKLDELFKATMKSRVTIIDQISKFILRQKSKKIRPILTFLSAKNCGEVTPSSYRAAMMIELLHTATLVHDDVVDNADTRRGFASVNAIWKNKVAVLMGDYFLSKGLLICIDANDFKILGVTSNAVRRMSEGELLQIQKSKQLDIDEKVYFKIISDKTASLLSASCEVGAISATDNQDKIINMRNFGENLGIAFQIQDDLLDYLGETSILGKSTGMDLKEKKITLPLIYALKNSSKSSVKTIVKMLKNDLQKKQINYIVDFVKASGGIEYARSKAEEFISKAEKCLDIFPKSESKDSLLKLLHFVTERNY
ncbi:MAG TPA: polyprenyl synthetase family protein [Ignavibacteria bacterium]|jgi:octaprenyl-diphosphate synthase